MEALMTRLPNLLQVQIPLIRTEPSSITVSVSKNNSIDNNTSMPDASNAPKYPPAASQKMNNP